MNPTLIRAFLVQRLTSPLRMLFLASFILMPLLFVAAAPGIGYSPLEDSFWFVIVIGAGAIGQDVSTGVLQLLLARPIRRAEYVTSRWLAIALGASGASLLQLGLATAILSARGAPPAWSDLAFALGHHVTVAFGAAASLVAFSALVAGLGDVGFMILLSTAGQIVSSVAAGMGIGWLNSLGRGLHVAMGPGIEFRRLIAPAPSWSEPLAYLSTLTIALVIAMAILDRRELSYASG